MSKIPEESQETTIPTVSEGSNTLGDISINNSVVASIVRLASLEVTGVASVGTGFRGVDGIAEIFTKKGDERGVRVEVDEEGRLERLPVELRPLVLPGHRCNKQLSRRH